MFNFPRTSSKTVYKRKEQNIEFLSFAVNVISLEEKRAALEEALIQQKIASVDELKYRQLINLALRFGAKLRSLSFGECESIDKKWHFVHGSGVTSVVWGDTAEAFWRNKNLFVHRLSRRSPLSLSGDYVNEMTEIACFLPGQWKLLLTIAETTGFCSFELIAPFNLTGFRLSDLNCDSSLTAVFAELVALNLSRKSLP
jgi:hypothetical protein